MWGRYLLELDADHVPGADDRPSLVAEEAARLGLPIRWSAPGAWLMAEPAAPVLPLARASGAILGSLFRRDDAATPVRGADVGAHLAIAQDPGRTLLGSYWGSYVAILCPPPDRGWIVVRDPSAAVPVYHLRRESRTFLASCPDLFLRLGLLRPEIDRDFVAHALVFPRMRTARTGLAGCLELLPGMVLDMHGSATPAWSPWPFASPDRQVTDTDQAAALLRRELVRTVCALVPRGRKLVLELSGGLDSSILAATLAEAAIPFSCVTFATSSADGDERRYARLVAERTGSALTELIESGRRPSLAPPPPRPRPGLTPVLRLIDDAILHHALDDGADLLLSGGGGDNVFCSLTTAAPAVDAYMSGGLRRGFTALRDVAAARGSTIWTASRFAVAKAVARRGRPPWRRNLTFLAPALADVAADLHPWLGGRQRCLPGKAEHVRAIVQIFDFLDASERGARVPMLFPLLAQPIVELCLRIPSWMWVRQGRNRAVARAAAEGLVPDPILRRSSKGRLEGLFVRGFAAIRPELRSLLLDGVLRRDGLIDGPAIERHLAHDGPRDHDRDYRLLGIAAVELWLRSWQR